MEGLTYPPINPSLVVIILVVFVTIVVVIARRGKKVGAKESIER